MWNWIKIRLGLKKPTYVESRKPLDEWFNKYKCCPDCFGTEFIKGPKGGLSRNMYCANEECGSRFNVIIIQGEALYAKRI